ncbi:hypothetical protein ACFX5E_02890 [Flavobacterium sp. LS2P90]|uniref:Uncharacterized protein n=1 Tax=Flavobacterium xylosi TaxID=3230415 RepID=A0ABW6HSP5_9FLAO
MKDYKDFTNFAGYVRDNLLFDIKLELTNMVILLKGNRQKIDDAIEYAKTNSDFDFEIHQPSHPNIPLDTDEDKFVYEKGELLANFSKERLDEVFRLYPLMCKEKNISQDPNDDNDISNSTNNNIIKNVAIGAGVVVGSYLLYQLFK